MCNIDSMKFYFCKILFKNIFAFYIFIRNGEDNRVFDDVVENIYLS